MREILFRGKRIDNGEWIEGSLVKVTIKGQTYYLIFGDNFSFNGTDVKALQHACVDPDTVGQYTGLTDKNGKKIFEGDVVAYSTNSYGATNKEIHEVVFETRGGSAYFGIRISEIETWQFCLAVPAKLMEVVGNIHDNPELLKGGAENDL